MVGVVECHRRHYVPFAHLVGGQSKFLGEWAVLMVLLWVCSGLYLPAQVPVHGVH